MAVNPRADGRVALRVTADADVIIAADTLAGEPPDVITEDLLEAVQSGELIGFGVCRCAECVCQACQCSRCACTICGHTGVTDEVGMSAFREELVAC